MVDVDLSKPAPNAVDFYVLRSNALEAYGSLEQSLSNLLAQLLRNDIQAAAAIFNRLGNTKSRNLILEDLLRQRHGETYSHFWHGEPRTKNKRGLMNVIQSLDGTRNEIVHWHVVRAVTENAELLMLMPPSFWVRPSTAQITTADMDAFILKADFAARAINMFNAFVQDVVPIQDEDWRRTWREIFHRPCPYPPADSHPLSRNYKPPETPP